MELPSFHFISLIFTFFDDIANAINAGIHVDILDSLCFYSHSSYTQYFLLNCFPFNISRSLFEYFVLNRNFMTVQWIPALAIIINFSVYLIIDGDGLGQHFATLIVRFHNFRFLAKIFNFSRFLLVLSLLKPAKSGIFFLKK